MPLDLTIVKHIHLTVEDARAFAHHIRSADVVSIESAAAVEGVIKEIEIKYRSCLVLKKDPGKIKELFHPSSSKKYYAELITQLAKYRKPLVFLERFSEKEARKINDPRGAYEYAESIKILHENGVEPALRHSYERALRSAEGICLRDKNIAENAFRIKDRFAELYPDILKKERINYVVGIGALHAPEKFLCDYQDGIVTVIALPSQNPSPLSHHWEKHVLERIIVEGASYEDCTDDLARATISALYRAAYRSHDRDHPLLLPLSLLVTRTMGVEDLRIIGRLRDETEYIRFFEERGIHSPLSQFNCDEFYRQLVEKIPTQ